MERKGSWLRLQGKARFGWGSTVSFLEDLERIGIASIQTGLSKNKIILIDEIGPMELFSEKFREVLETALKAPNSLVATIAEKSLLQYRETQPVRIIRIDQENRDYLVFEILKELGLG